MSSHSPSPAPDTAEENSQASRVERFVEGSIFASRWLQAPLYLGLIIAQMIYVCQFMAELWHLIHIFISGGKIEEVSNHIMIGILGLIDVVMVANLVIMVVIGGYETFVSRLDLDGKADKPEWLSHVNAGVLKIKLGTALISISSIHLLKTFIQVRDPEFKIVNEAIAWQVGIHVIFLVSALVLAWTDRIMMNGVRADAENH